jgi:hypothetical protein
VPHRSGKECNKLGHVSLPLPRTPSTRAASHLITHRTQASLLLSPAHVINCAPQVYPDPVRVVSVGKSVDDLLAKPDCESHEAHAIEFCGGTHLSNTEQARAFALLSEEGIAKGIRCVGKGVRPQR